jgi:hypothetical protein
MIERSGLNLVHHGDLLDTEEHILREEAAILAISKGDI